MGESKRRKQKDPNYGNNPDYGKVSYDEFVDRIHKIATSRNFKHYEKFVLNNLDHLRRYTDEVVNPQKMKGTGMKLERIGGYGTIGHFRLVKDDD